MFYGLLIAGGLFAYYVWKNNSKKSKKETLTNSTSGNFADDVSVLKIKPIKTALFKLDDEIKKSVSIIS